MSDEQTKDDALTPWQAQSLTRRSAALARRGLAQALTLQSSQSYYNRGCAKHDEGDIGGAIDDFTRAIEVDPRYAAAYGSRGCAKHDHGDSDSAIADFTKAIEIDPGYAKAYYNRGLALDERDDHDGAIADYSKAVEIDPRNAPAYNNRGVAKWYKGDLASAITDYTNAIEIDPGFAEAYHNRGLAKKDRGDHEGAIADCAKAIELDPETPALRDSASRMSEPIQSPRRFNPEILDLIQKLAANRVEAGITTVDGLVDAVYEAVSEAAPGTSKREVREAISGYGYGWENGWAEIKKRLRELESEVPRDEAAISSLRQASATIGEDIALLFDVLETLSSDYQRAGSFKESADVLEIMIDLIPDEPLIHHLLGCTYEVLEWWNLAERAYADALRLDPDKIEAKIRLERVQRLASELEE